MTVRHNLTIYNANYWHAMDELELDDPFYGLTTFLDSYIINWIVDEGHQQAHINYVRNLNL